MRFFVLQRDKQAVQVDDYRVAVVVAEHVADAGVSVDNALGQGEMQALVLGAETNQL